MAKTTDHSDADLATALDHHADAIIENGNGIDGHEAEPFVREAAERLRMPLLSRLTDEIRRAAKTTTDPATGTTLRRLTGEDQ